MPEATGGERHSPQAPPDRGFFHGDRCAPRPQSGSQQEQNQPLSSKPSLPFLPSSCAEHCINKLNIAAALIIGYPRAAR